MSQVFSKMPKRKQSGRPNESAKPEKASTKIDAELLRQAKTVAAFRNVDLYDYLDQILRKRVADDYRTVVRDDDNN